MLLQIVPYILGATISPVLLAVTVILLAQKNKPISKTFAFFLGGLATAIPVGTAIFFLAHSRITTSRPTLSDSVVHIIVGLLLLILAYRAWTKPASRPKPAKAEVHYIRNFIAGMALVASDFTSLIMFIPAGIELQKASLDVRLTGLGLLIIALTMAIWLPLVVVIVLGKRGKKLLKKADTIMARHGQQVTACVLLLIAAYVFYKGISGL